MRADSHSSWVFLISVVRYLNGIIHPHYLMWKGQALFSAPVTLKMGEFKQFQDTLFRRLAFQGRSKNLKETEEN